MRLKKVSQECARNSPSNHRQKRAEFEHPVAPREQRLGQQFRKQSILGRTEERRLRAGQKYGGHFNIQVLPAQACDGKKHNCHLQNLGSDRDGALAVPVGQKSARH